jgi:hypothetical protein
VVLILDKGVAVSLLIWSLIKSRLRVELLLPTMIQFNLEIRSSRLQLITLVKWMSC